MAMTAYDSKLPSGAGIPLVVGLTTLPSRIGQLRPTLASLLEQTRPPDQILLCLPRWSQREQCEYSRPGWLADFHPVLNVVDCERDFGPGTKLLGCIQHLSRPSCLVIADDDMRYKQYFLQVLYEAQLEYPRSSFSFYTFPCGPFTVGQGADGFSFYSPNLAGVREFANQVIDHPKLRLVDDLWISAYLKREGIAVKSLKPRILGGGTIYEVSHSLNQLRDLTGDATRDSAMLEGTQFLLESGLMGKPARFRALLTKWARRFRNRLASA